MKNVKYFWKGNLIRTSHREYTHAVVAQLKEGGKPNVLACCGRYDLAVKAYNFEKGKLEDTLRRYIGYRNGTIRKDDYMATVTNEELDKWIEGKKKAIAAIQIVELTKGEN